MSGDRARTTREIGLIQFTSSLIRYRRRVAAVALAAAALAVAVVMFRGTRYSVAVSVVSSGSASGVDSRLKGIASQLGLGGLGQGGAASITASSAVLMTLLESPTLLGRVVDSAITVPAFSAGSSNVVDILLGEPEPEGTDSLARLTRRQEAIRKLRSVIQAERSRETEVVSFRVTTRTPELSYYLASRLVDELDRFNLEIGQAQASEERRFIEGRMSDQSARLAAEEARLTAFLRTNRQYREAPDLAVEYERLQRAVGLQQQVLNGLAESAEDVRLREVRDTPVLTTIEPPRFPVERDSRGLLKWAMLGLVFGTAIAMAFELSALVVRTRLAAGDSDLDELIHEIGAARSSSRSSEGT